MRKGQSLVIQFMIFFLIGLGLLTIIGNLFKFYSEIIREEIALGTRRLLSSYFSSLSIISVNSCKQCSYVEIRTRISNTSADYYHQLYLSQLGLYLISEPGSKSLLTSMHNLNSTYTLLGNASSVRTIIFTFTKNQNKIEVKQ